jgi:hypothetical protein
MFVADLGSFAGAACSPVICGSGGFY